MESADNFVKSKIFDTGNIDRNAKAVCKFLNSGLTKCQIISICMSEASVNYSENMMVVFYRHKPRNRNASEIEGIGYHLVQEKLNKSWDDIISEEYIKAHVNKTEGSIIALVHSSCNEGEGKNRNNMVIFQQTHQEQYEEEIQVLNNMEEYGECTPVVSSMPKYMKLYVMPHELMSFSIYEDSHPFPQKDGFLNCTVLHRAPVEAHRMETQTKNETEIYENRIIPLKNRVFGDLQSTDYKYEVIEATQKGYRKQIWGSAIDLAVKHMNKIGANEGHLVSCFNKTEKDTAAVAIISWSRVIEDHFLSQARPAGCCNSCNIF